MYKKTPLFRCTQHAHPLSESFSSSSFFFFRKFTWLLDAAYLKESQMLSPSFLQFFYAYKYKKKSSVRISFQEVAFPLQLWHEIKLICGMVCLRQWRQCGVDVNSNTTFLFHPPPHWEGSMAVWVIPSYWAKQHGAPATDNNVSLRYGCV